MSHRDKVPSSSNFCGRTRRQFLWEMGAGFVGVALAGMLEESFFAQQALAADGIAKWTNPLAAKPPHFTPKAKSGIFLHMYGGPSHIDTFDYKPAMKGMDGKTVAVQTFGRGGHKSGGGVVATQGRGHQEGAGGRGGAPPLPHPW